jgi:hypothetical protein
MRSATRIAARAWLLAGMAAAAMLTNPACGAPEEGEVVWISDQHGCKVANPAPRPGESITWSGECKNGFANGQGVLQWYLDGQADDRYEGNLDLGWASGQGVMARPDGSKYAGEWKDSAQHGNGRFEAPDGSWYEGEWKNGKPHGQGQYRRPDGKIFIGVWVDGVYEGDMEPEPEEDFDPNRT